MIRGKRKAFAKAAILVLLFLFVNAQEINAQWFNITGGKLNPKKDNTYVSGDVLIHKNDKFLFASGNALWISSDLGISWVKQATMPVCDHIFDIDIFDSLHYVVANDRGIYLTEDGGLSWSYFLVPYGCTTARYINSSKDIVVIGGRGGITISHDGFHNNQFEDISPIGQPQLTALLINKNGEILTIGGYDGVTIVSRLFTSGDNGKIWRRSLGTFDWDCWSFAIDSCDKNLIVIVNEETFQDVDGLAGIYVSTDGGDSFTFTNSTIDRKYFCGSVSIAPLGAIFVQTTRDGVLRSLDSGRTWISIGGPCGGLDSKLVCALTPDLIYAADTNGDVWVTMNSGGFLTGYQYIRFRTPPILYTDTLGGIVSIPIILSSQSILSDITMNLNFGASENLVYSGTTSKDGIPIDITGSQTPSASSIKIPSAYAIIGDTIAYANFRLFADTDDFDTVIFTLEPQLQCANTQTATILGGPRGCGIKKISRFLHINKLLSIISLRPNPASSMITADISSVVAVKAEIEIYSILGDRIRSESLSLFKGVSPIHIDTKNIESGSYILRVSSADGTVSERFVIGR